MLSRAQILEFAEPEATRVYGLEVPTRRCLSCGWRFPSVEDDDTCPDCVESETIERTETIR